MPPPETPEEVKVFIVLKDAARSDPRICAAAISAIVKAGALRELDEHRVATFGIISGLVFRDRIPAIEALPSVASVSVNQKRRIPDG